MLLEYPLYPENKNAKCNPEECIDAPDFLFNGKSYND
jgi:hypothetical protein